MICPNCKKEIPDGSRFCGACGAKIDENVLQSAQAEQGKGSSGNEDAGSDKTGSDMKSPLDGLKNNSQTKLIIAAAVAVVLVVVLIFAFSGGGSRKTININDYVAVTFSGYDTIGTASAEFDYDSFYEDYEDLEWDEDALSDYLKAEYADYDISDEDIEEAVTELVEMYEPAEFIYEGFYYAISLSQEDGLSNGDTVTLTWAVEDEGIEDLMTCLNCELEYSDIEATVEGLQELETYNPFDDIEVSFSGTDTIGTASAEITGSGDIASSLRYSLDQTNYLSNGDTVTVTITTDADAFAESDGVILSPVEQEYTVEGLQELETYNPFDDIEVSFSGTEPGGTASISVTGSGLAQSIRFSLDVSSGLSNGDTVTVSVSNDADAFVSSDGVILSPTEQEYTVEGLSRYITSAEEIPDEDLAQMQEEVQDSFDSYVASSWNSVWTVKGFDYIGSYLLTSKTDDGNIFYMVYQVNAEYFNELSSGFADLLFTYYYYVRYDNLVMNSEDELQVDYLDFGTVGNDYTIYSDSDSKYKVKGYETLDEIYKVLVTERADSYTCEDLVEDADFGYEATKLDEVAAIPDDAKEFNGHYYKLYSVEDMTWTQAKEQCELRGGHLVTITSEDEMNFLAIQLVSGSRSYWTGGYYDVSGEWLWITGESMDYTNWLTSKSAVSYPYIILCEAGWMQNEEDGSNNGGVATSLSQGYNSSVIGYICEWDSDDVDAAVDTAETVENAEEETADEESAEDSSGEEDE